MEHYVYVYLDPTKKGVYEYGALKFDYEPFYIGKGKGLRCYTGLEDYKIKKANKKIKLTFKDKKILKLLKLNFQPYVSKIFQNLTDEESSIKEIELISLIGRRDLKTGPLTNMSVGGDGYTHNSAYVKYKLSKPVLQYDLDGNFIKEYSSTKEAGLALNVAAIQISRVCKKYPRYHTASGFKWEYKYPDELQKHIKDRNLTIVRKKHSLITKQKMSKTKKWNTLDGKHPSNGKTLRTKHPPILQYDLKNIFIKEWPSIAIICKHFKYGRMKGYLNIYRNIKFPKRNKSAYGYIWKFKEITL